MAYTLLKDVEVGSLVKVNESGVPVEFYVAKHDYESDLNGTGRTLLVRKDAHSAMALDSNKANEYSTSTIDMWLNSEYVATLDELTQNHIGTTEFPYTNKTSNTVSTLTRGVFLLSVTELGLTLNYANVEGTALSIASDLQIAYFDGTAVDQWTRTPYNSNTSTSCYVKNTGVVSGANSYTATYYARPAFTLPNDKVFINDDGTVNFNPVFISGEDEYLGRKTNDFSIEYSVTTLRGTEATITEYYNEKVLRTFTAADGEIQTAVLDIKNSIDGRHNFTIKAVSDTGETAERRYALYSSPINIHRGGTVQEFQDENGDAIFPATLAKAVLTTSGESVEQLLSNLIGANSYAWGVYQPPNQPYKINSEVVNITISRTTSYDGVGDTSFSITYADEIECSESTISLLNPISWSGHTSSSSDAKELSELVKGKFIRIGNMTYYVPTTIENPVTQASGVITTTSPARRSYSMRFQCQSVSVSMITDMLFLGVTFSQNINAYPENGVQDYWHYVLFGNLIESIVNSTPRIEMGRYTGTGTHGENSPCSITFKHKPKIVWICANGVISTSVGIGGQPWVYGAMTAGTTTSSSYIVTLTWSGNTLSWWSKDVSQQLNSSGVVYNYFALY